MKKNLARSIVYYIFPFICTVQTRYGNWDTDEEDLDDDDDDDDGDYEQNEDQGESESVEDEEEQFPEKEELPPRSRYGKEDIILSGTN